MYITDRPIPNLTPYSDKRPTAAKAALRYPPEGFQTVAGVNMGEAACASYERGEKQISRTSRACSSAVEY
jgi:hypothetical protein